MTSDQNDKTPLHEDSDVGDDAGGHMGAVADQRVAGFVVSYMKQDGWIKLHRSLRDHWLMTKPDYLAIWIWIMLNTNHDRSTAMVGGKLVTVERGEVLVSVRSLAKQTGTSEQKVRSALKLFIIDSMLEAKSNTGATHLKVLNYNRLQSADREQVTHGQHTDNTIKELRIKKKKEEETITYEEGTLSRARPRSPDEVATYFAELGSTDTEAATFWDHFTSNGWRVGGRATMKDWRATARNWVRRSGKNQSTGNAKRSVGDRQAAIDYQTSFKQLEAERDAVTDYIVGRTRDKQNQLAVSAVRRLGKGTEDRGQP